jgi:hypothetical protein
MEAIVTGIRSIQGALILASAAMLACGPTQPLTIVRAADPSAFKNVPPGAPFVIEFDEGETIPLSFTVRGPMMETAPDSPHITLVARRHFFLRVQGHEFASSLDGVHFDARKTAPGSFFVGFAFAPSGTTARIEIVTPTYDLPAR